MRITSRFAVVVLAGTQAAACYTYRQIEPSAIEAGRTIRVTVEADEAVRQQEVVGTLTQTFEGQAVAGQAPETLGLTVAARTAGGPGARSDFNIFLSLRRSSITQIEEKRFNAGRTVAVAGVGVVIAIAALTIDGGGTDSGEGGPGGDARVRVPLIRIPFR